jgi:hypothetical protein
MTIALLVFSLIKIPKVQVRSPYHWLSHRCLGFLLLDQYSHHIAHFFKTSLITENIAPKICHHAIHKYAVGIRFDHKSESTGA